MFEIARPVFVDLVRRLDEVVFENAVAAFWGLALVGFFVRAAALFGSWHDACVGAELFARSQDEAGTEFGIDPCGEGDTDAADGKQEAGW